MRRPYQRVITFARVRGKVCVNVWQNDGRSMWMGVKDTDILWDVSKKERESVTHTIECVIECTIE